MNILYISPNMYMLGKTFRYYSDLYNELKKITNCHFHRRNTTLPFRPDVIVFGLGWLNKPLPLPAGLPNVPTICFSHKSYENWERKAEFFKNIDLVLSPHPGIGQLFKYAADPEVFKPRNDKVYDFGFSGALHNASHYPKGVFGSDNVRERIQELVRTQTDLSLFLNGSDDIKKRIMSYEKYAKTVAQSKTWLSTTTPGGAIGPRHYQIWASKTLLFCDRVPTEYRDTFRDGVNCIEFADDLSDFLPKLRYYLENEAERKTIIDKAYSDFIAGHTWSKRAEELCCIIKNMVNTKTTSKTR